MFFPRHSFLSLAFLVLFILFLPLFFISPLRFLLHLFPALHVLSPCLFLQIFFLFLRFLVSLFSFSFALLIHCYSWDKAMLRQCLITSSSFISCLNTKCTRYFNIENPEDHYAECDGSAAGTTETNDPIGSSSSEKKDIHCPYCGFPCEKGDSRLYALDIVFEAIRGIIERGALSLGP